MKRLFAKVRRLRMTCWNKLTLGEKIIKVIISLLKVAAIVAIVAVGVAIAGAVVASIAGIVIAFGIVSAIAGGLDNASRAYRPGDRYIKFW